MFSAEKMKKVQSGRINGENECIAQCFMMSSTRPNYDNLRLHRYHC